MDSSRHIAVIGIVSSPANDWRRAWARRFQTGQPGLLIRFVLGAVGLAVPQCQRLLDEDQRHGDIIFVQASDNEQVGCVDKSFGWFMAAASRFPAAQFIVKTDDDSATHTRDLARLLRLMRPHPLAYAGWAQFASVVPATWQQCGWGASPGSALRRRQGGCAVGAEGPFVFGAGALEIFSGALVRHVFTSDWTQRFVSAAREAAGGGLASPETRWNCYAEDALVGFAVHANARRAGLEGVAFVALNGRVVNVQNFLSCRALAGWLRGEEHVLTVHKFEPLERELRAEEEFEDTRNVIERKEGKPIVRHKHAHARANRLVRAHVEAGLGGGRAPAEGGQSKQGWGLAAEPNFTLACRNRADGVGDAFFELPGTASWQTCWLVGGQSRPSVGATRKAKARAEDRRLQLCAEVAREAGVNVTSRRRVWGLW